MFLPNFLKHTLIAKRYAKLSRDEIKSLQLAKFHKLVHYISNNSPYYKQIIKDNKIDIDCCQPQDFPILSKEDVINKFDSIVTDQSIRIADIKDFLKHSYNSNDLFLGKYFVIHTSGSSGVTGYHVFNKTELVQGVVGIGFGNKPRLLHKMAFVGSADGHFAGITMCNLARKLPFLYKEIKTFDTNQPFQTIIDGLNEMQPTLITAYVFMLKMLAKEQKKGNLHIKPLMLQSGGEPLYNKDKEYIEKAFSVPIVNVYACSEHLILGVGKQSYEGMYLLDYNFIFEMGTDSTLITNLYNYTLPLIRYRMTDRISTSEDTKKNLPFTKVSNIDGRHEDVPIFLNNLGNYDFINPLDFSDINPKHLDKLQVHVVDKTSFIVKVSFYSGTTEAQENQAKKIARDQIRLLLDKKAMTNVNFKIETVKSLWADPKTGKYQYVKFV